MSETERQPDPMAALLHRAVEFDADERLAAKNQFLRRLDRELERSRNTGNLVRHGVPLALAASVLLALLLFWPRGGLEYTVQGAGRDGDYVRAAADRPAEITFSDQTRIHASPGARLRIGDLKKRSGVRVALERGSIDVEVTHTESASWRFDAGPFKVQVTGTRFLLAWDANAEQLELVLHEGSVNVQGYAGSGVVSVHEGQRFFGDARRRTMFVTDVARPIEPGETPTPAGTTSAGKTEAKDEPSAHSATGSSSSAPASSGSHATKRNVSWSELVSRGAFQQVVDEAVDRGVSSCFASCGADDLNALADAARYVGRREVAEQALLALRSRYASAYGVRAAFLLGRLHENRGSMATAKSWYETALREGGGAFASEALAGKMRTVNALEGRAAARAVARDYLRRYPKGVHATAARQLAEDP